VSSLDLRPLSLGEILDRTFSLYRNNFVLFIGIAAIPQLAVLAYHLAQVWLSATPVVSRDPARTALSPGAGAFVLLGGLIGGAVYITTYLFAQGGTVYAVSEL
jgi:hypothetical protein